MRDHLRRKLKRTDSRGTPSFDPLSNKMQPPCTILQSLSADAGDEGPPDGSPMSEQELAHAIDFFNRAMEQLEHHPGIFESFLNILTSHSDPVECYYKVSEVLKDFHNLRNECKRFMTPELTPSYKILSEERRRTRTSSGVSELGTEVLNNDLVLKRIPTTNSSSGRCENSRVMRCRKRLFDCEDEHYEMDMIINTARAAIARGERILSGGGGDAGEHLTAADLRCIEQIYGKAGLEVVNRLQESPGTVLPVVLGRLRQKEAEWVKCRSEMEKRWKQVNAENYYPSMGYPKRPS